VKTAVGLAFMLVVLASWHHAHAQAGQTRRAPTAQTLSPGETTRREMFKEWAKIREPLTGPAAAIGSYAAGCLQGAEALPLDGDGYSVMRPSRNRFYGHPSLLSYLTNLAATTRAKYGTQLLIGDMAPPRGGPMQTGHVSHQNGLDADVRFTTLATRPTDAERERLPATFFVVGRTRLRPNWGEEQARLLAAAADDDRVSRIFVSPPIKRYMCQNYQAAPWLYRLRPWWGHEDHFHVRLLCPSGSSLCQEQDALDPTDTGCGENLAWWFSAEADREWHRLSTSTEPRQFPALPTECTAIAR
jgi:penicillin-insensitive murein endopeptidase